MGGSEALLSAFDVDEMSTEALLFQTGSLTILEEENRNGGSPYRLGYPNREVRQSLNERLLYALLPEAVRRLADNRSLRELLVTNDFEGLEALFRAVFAGIPYEWHTRNDIAHYEGYYASVFYSYFVAQGFDLIPEESTPGDARIWRSASTATCICSSSRRSSERRKERRWRSSGGRATPTSTGTWASPST